MFIKRTKKKITNAINSHNKRFAIKSAGTDNEDQLKIVRADSETLGYGDAVLGNFDGVTGEITIRIYNCSDSQLNAIKNGGDVVKIQTF